MKKKSKKNWPEPGCGVCGSILQLPPFPPSIGSLTAFLVWLVFTLSRRGQRGRGARCSPGRERSLRPESRQPAPPASPSFPYPKRCPGPFSPRFPSFCQCAPRRGGSCRRRAPARCPGGAGNRRRDKETNFVEATARPSQPACGGVGRMGVDWGFLVGFCLRVGPVLLLRAVLPKVRKPPRVSFRKCIKNRCRRRVCLKSGCGSAPGHFRLSSPAL